MLRVFALFAMIVSSTALAEDLPCANLSRQIVYPSRAPFEWIQVGCDYFEIYQVVDGQRIYITRLNVSSSPEWRSENLDDEYHVGQKQTRWFWSNDRQKLIMDYQATITTKATGGTMFSATSSTLSISDNNVVEHGGTLVRTQTKDGNVSINVEEINHTFPRIPVAP